MTAAHFVDPARLLGEVVAEASPDLPAPAGAIVSHMEIGMRELRNETTAVIAAVEAGEHVTLTIRGQPVADIVPHARRTPWLSGPMLHHELSAGRAADPELADELDLIAGQTLADL